LGTIRASRIWQPPWARRCWRCSDRPIPKSGRQEARTFEWPGGILRPTKLTRTAPIRGCDRECFRGIRGYVSSMWLFARAKRLRPIVFQCPAIDPRGPSSRASGTDHFQNGRSTRKESDVSHKAVRATFRDGGLNEAAGAADANACSSVEGFSSTVCIREAEAIFSGRCSIFGMLIIEPL
jgi:hypothetical protein